MFSFNVLRHSDGSRILFMVVLALFVSAGIIISVDQIRAYHTGNDLWGFVKDGSGNYVDGMEVRYCLSSSAMPSSGCTSSSTGSSEMGGKWHFYSPPTSGGYYRFWVVAGTSTSSEITYYHNGASGSFYVGDLVLSSSSSGGGGGGGSSSSNYTLSVTMNGSGNVQSSPAGINCGMDSMACTYSYASGTSVSLTTTPATGYLFSGWGGDCFFAGNNQSCVLNMTAGKSVTAYFTASSSGNPTGTDLVIIDFGYSTGSSSGQITVGQSVSFFGKVRNNGSAAAVSSTTRLYLDGAIRGDMPTGNLAANSVEPESWSNAWVATAGSHNYSICADALSQVAESNESNNCFGGFITVGSTSGSTSLNGKVWNAEGVGIANIRVEAWMPEGNGFQSTTTGSDGSYTISVGPGTWELRPFIDSTSGYAFAEPFSRRVTAESGVSQIGLNFTLRRGDATILGRVLDDKGALLSNVRSWVGVEGIGVGAEVTNGNFTLRLPAGSHYLKVWFPPESGYVHRAPVLVNVAAGQTATIDLIGISQASGGKIEGTLIDVSGAAVTNVSVRVFAGSYEHWMPGTVDPATGKFAVLVPPGTWHLGFEVLDPRYVSGGKVGEPIGIVSGQIATRNITLVRAGASLNVTVNRLDGTPFAAVGVEVSSAPFSPEFQEGASTFDFRAFVMTDAQGIARFSVPPGTFYARAFAPPELGAGINPPERSIIVADGGTASTVLSFRTANVTVSGRVLYNGSPVADAFVGGWSKTGGFVTARSAVDGSYSLSVANDVWNLKAGSNVNGILYESVPVSLDMASSSSASQDLLLGTTNFIIPQPLTTTHTATEVFSARLENGVTVGCGAVCFAQSGDVSIVVEPDIEAPDQGARRVIGMAYNIEARKTDGSLIRTLGDEAVVSIPYSVEDLNGLTLNEADLQIAYFDEATGTWLPLETSVVDTAANMVTGTTDHLTRFALVTPSYGSVVSVAVNEGDLIRGPDGVKVYIVNALGYRRHIFNPAVFGMYGHFTWGSIKSVSQATLDSYTTSDLYRAEGDPKVYSLEEVSEAAGSAVKHWLDMSADRFTQLGYSWNQVFVVNSQERDYYQTGTAIK